jgi:hypothetical protein
VVLQLVTDTLLGTAREELEAIVAAHDTATQQYKEYREYWEGKHAVRLTARMKQFLANNGFHGDTAGFRNNLCPLVIETLSDRLKIAGFTVPGEDVPVAASVVPGDPEAAKIGPVAQFAAETWAQNRGARLQMRVHTNSIGVGDAFVMVEWDAVRGRVRFTYNDPTLVRVWFDPEDSDEIVMASKRWVVSEQPAGSMVVDAKQSVRLNVYKPDRIERYIRNGLIGGGAWRHFTDAANPEWPIDWTDANGEPLGIPVVLFANNDHGGQYGRSEIADVIPLQDALNKTVVDAVRIMDAQGWPQRYALGVAEAPSDDLVAVPGAMFWSKSENATMGTLDSASPTGIIELWNKFEESVAAITRTPQHAFRVTNGLPSGEALKTAESGLVAKAEKRATGFGDAWEDVMTIAVRLARANGVLAAELPASGFAVEWESFETRSDELQRIQAINSKEGISERQRWREYGYTDEQIERMEEEKEQEREIEAEVVATSLGGAFDRGSP